MLNLLLCMNLFLAPNDPRLNERSYNICSCHIPQEDTQQIIDTMYNVAFGETQDRSRSILVGLAAPQIGFNQRIILVDVAATGVFTKESEPPPPQLKEFINPEIIWKSQDQIVWREGCFSTDRICGLVPRAKEIIVRYYDRQGNIFTDEFSGYVARIFQHEIDHLDGIRFPDRIENNDDLHWVELDEISDYRINWMNWSKKCLRETWIEMKNGHPL